MRTRVRHRARWIGVALAALAAAAAAALYVGDRDVDVLPPGSFVVALDSDGGIGSFTEATTAPSNLAVGEGAVWVLDSEAETVARLDPVTQAVERFAAGPRPTDLAVGGGAVWVGNGAGSESFDQRVTTSISRVDPGSLEVTGTVELSREQSAHGPPPSLGFPQMAVGAGALWAVGADNRIYRIDPATSRIVAKIPVVAGVNTLAAGAEGVWFLNWTDHDVTRIDPATNRVADRIPVDGDSGIAVGGGAVWVTSPDDGRLWRIEPGRPPRKRPIDVGGQPDFVSYGDGAAWTGDYQDGVLTRVDARTNTVTKRVRDRSGPGAGRRRRLGLGQRRGRDPGGHVAAGGLHPRRVRWRDARRADRVRSPAPGRRRGHHARARGRDPLGAQGPRLPRGPARGRLPVVRRIDGADRRLRAPALRRERQRVRARRAGRGRDRPVSRRSAPSCRSRSSTAPPAARSRWSARPTATRA